MATLFDDDCDWPRRLLHVPSMTSYKWGPGDVYGNVVKPKYSALTYTWGRWRLLPDEMPEITALPVKGVTWPLPRIDPDHFSARQLQECLDVISEDSSKVDNCYVLLK